MNVKINSSLGLLFPEPLASGSGAGVESPSGGTPPASPAEENFYSKAEDNGGAEQTSETGQQQDFTGDKPLETEGAEAGAEGDTGVVAAAPVETKPMTLKLDQETIDALRREVAPQQTKSEPARLSPQQLKEMLNPVEVSDDIVANMSHEDPAVRRETLQQFANATVKNAVSIARVMIQQAERRAEMAISPLAQHHQQAQHEATKTAFFSKHPDLTKYGKLVVQAAQEVGADPAAANFSPEQSFKAVADRVRATLKEFGVPIQAPANLGAEAGQVVPKANKLSPSGRSGGDTGGQRGKANDADADIYKR